MIPTRVGQTINNATFIGFVQTATQIRWVAVDTQLRLNARIPVVADRTATNKTCGYENTQYLIARYNCQVFGSRLVPIQNEMMSRGLYIAAQYEAVLIKKRYKNMSMCVPRTRSNESSLHLEEFISKHQDDTLFITSTVSPEFSIYTRAVCVDLKLSAFKNATFFVFGYTLFVKSNVACENTSE